MTASAPIFRWVILALFAASTCRAATADVFSLDVNEDAEQELQATEEERLSPEEILALQNATFSEVWIGSVTECDWRDLGPQGCRHPVTAYPTMRTAYLEWDWEKHYTITWSNIDDNYPQQFQWDTEYCGSLNKTLEKGQRSFEFSFKELATEFPQSQCGYSLREIQRLANSDGNMLRVRQPKRPGSGFFPQQGVGKFAILDFATIDAIKGLQESLSECSNREAPPKCDIWMALASLSTTTLCLFAVVAIVFFYIGTGFFRRDRGVKLQ